MSVGAAAPAAKPAPARAGPAAPEGIPTTLPPTITATPSLAASSLAVSPPSASPPPAPLQFVFPSPPPPPESAWRPPLYPTPWEPTPYDHFYFTRPIAADEINWPLADYRYGGVFFGTEVHTGVDVPAPIGTQVLAAAGGKVTWAGYGLYAQKEDLNDPYGLAVAIKHDFGYDGETLYTIYGHMSQIFVSRGQRVNGGDVIGLVGETGRVTGPHLHFEVRLQKNNFYGSRNPELWISPPQGWGLLAGRVMDSSSEPLTEQTVKVISLDTRRVCEVNTYGSGSANSDPYYRENVVMGDLPAGNYELLVEYEGTIFNHKMQIRPGMVSYFRFQGKKGFSAEPPSPPEDGFTPPDSENPAP
jgi:murein DD-endopeptidase MepM/ murein hydrolase activator NlpD